MSFYFVFDTKNKNLYGNKILSPLGFKCLILGYLKCIPFPPVLTAITELHIRIRKERKLNNVF